MRKLFNYERLKELMKEKNINQNDILFYLSEQGVDYTLNGVKNWFRKDEKTRKVPEMQTIALLAKLFKVSINELVIGADTDNIIPLKPIPVVGSASCGIPDLNALQEADKYTYYPVDDWNDEMYATIANGDSMSLTIEDGDEVVCDPKAGILSGDIVHYQINGESAIKTYIEIKKKNKILFVPLNKEFETKEFIKDDEIYANIRMVKVVDVKKSVRNDRKSRLRTLGY